MSIAAALCGRAVHWDMHWSSVVYRGHAPGAHHTVGLHSRAMPRNEATQRGRGEHWNCASVLQNAPGVGNGPCYATALCTGVAWQPCNGAVLNTRAVVSTGDACRLRSRVRPRRPPGPGHATEPRTAPHAPHGPRTWCPRRTALPVMPRAEPLCPAPPRLSSAPPWARPRRPRSEGRCARSGGWRR